MTVSAKNSPDMKIHIRNVAQDPSVNYFVVACIALVCPVKYFGRIDRIPY